MLPLNLVLALVVSLPPSLAALSGAGHRPAPGAHNLFASPGQASSLLERAAANAAEEASAFEEELGLEGPASGELDLEELLFAKVNLTLAFDDWEEDEGDVEARLARRGLPRNPKYIPNPKYTPRTKPPTAATTVAPSTNTPRTSTPSTTVKPSTTTRTTTTTKKASTSKTTTSKTTTTSKAAATTALVLPKPPSANCWEQYTNTVAGAVYGPGLGDFPMLPRPSTFVTRTKSGLYLEGREYRIVGPNIYWLGLEENVYPSPSYPDKGRVREAMAISVAMGANTIRAHTLGISTGTSLSVWPSAYVTNNKAFESIDYAIWAARNYGLRLIIPLTDEHAYYHGGKYDFIRWAGANTNDGSQFYKSQATINLFKAYIKVLLNRVNQFTGVAYKDDPTILAWETGNELGAYMLSAGAPPASWTNEIGNYIKSIAPNQLVADGTDGLVNYDGGLANTGVAVAPVDLVTDHFYPALNWLLQKDKAWMQYYTKNFYVGELDWTYAKGGDSPASFYSILENMDHSGSMIWSVFGHDAQCCNWVDHNDGYTLHYPNGNSEDLQKQILLLLQHWYRMRGLTPPRAMPAVACPQPELLP